MSLLALQSLEISLTLSLAMPIKQGSCTGQKLTKTHKQKLNYTISPDLYRRSRKYCLGDSEFSCSSQLTIFQLSISLLDHSGQAETSILFKILYFKLYLVFSSAREMPPEHPPNSPAAAAAAARS